VNVLKNGACHRQCSTAADTIKGAHALTPAATQLPRARVSCPSRSVEAGHLCGKKMRPATPRADTRALGTGSSNMLSAISLQRTAQCRGLARAEERNERKAAQRRGAAYSRFKRVKPVKLSGSVPFKRLSLRSLWWHPTQRNQKHTSRGERESVDSVSSKRMHACVRVPVRARMRVCACMRAGAGGGCVFGARRSHLVDLVPALKATDERRERPNQPQASRMKGAGTATAVALRRAAPRPRAAGLLRHRNRVEAFGRRSSRRRGRRPCKA